MKTAEYLATNPDENNSSTTQDSLDSLIKENETKQQTEEELTCLMKKAIIGDIEGVEELLHTSETDINTKVSGRTALMWAIEPSNNLIKNRNTYTKKNPLYTEKERRIKIIEKLILHANIESTTDNGKTALIIAAKHGKDYAVEMLLKAGAKKDVKCHGGWTALDYARAYEHKTNVHKNIINLLDDKKQANLL